MEKQISKENYKDGLEEKVENKKWAEKFLKTDDWKKLAMFISEAYPGTSPYTLKTMEQIREQGGFIKGLTYPETLLLSLIKEGEDAEQELKTNPDAQ
jgi:hypothetical protein